MSKFKVGDKVRILDGSDIKGYSGGWVDDMEKHIGKICTIERILIDGSIGYRMKEIGYMWDERGLELAEDKPKHKFKVGDKVIAKKDNGHRVTTNGWRGIVTYVGDHYFTAKGPGGTFDVLKYDGFDLANDQKIVITHDGKTTTAKLFENKKCIKTAKAKCSPSDEFDFNVGASIAFERLTGQILGKVENTLFDWDGFKAGNFNVIVNCDSIDRFLEECEAHEINWGLRKATEFNPIQGIMDFDSTNECELEVVEGELVYSFKPEIKESTVTL